jgi:hypothetical protein
MRPLPRILKVLTSLTLIAGATVGVFFWRAHVNRRSIPGHIVRWFQGEGGFYQTVNDLAEDIRQQPTLAELQPWSVQILERFSSGEIHTNGSAAYWSVGTIRLAAQETPAFVTQLWGLTNRWSKESPEISVRLSTNRQPECVVIAWYLHGIVAGPPEYRLSFQPWCYAQAKPGVYAYHLYK